MPGPQPSLPATRDGHQSQHACTCIRACARVADAVVVVKLWLGEGSASGLSATGVTKYLKRHPSCARRYLHMISENVHALPCLPIPAHAVGRMGLRACCSNTNTRKGGQKLTADLATTTYVRRTLGVSVGATSALLPAQLFWACRGRRDGSCHCARQRRHGRGFRKFGCHHPPPSPHSIGRGVEASGKLRGNIPSPVAHRLAPVS